MQTCHGRSFAAEEKKGQGFLSKAMVAKVKDHQAGYCTNSGGMRGTMGGESEEVVEWQITSLSTKFASELFGKLLEIFLAEEWYE